jgi:hypothetical protein
MMDESVNVKKQVARNAWNQVFENIGGISHLQEWAIGNPTEFYRIFSKLAPPMKDDSKGKEITHDKFIKMLMNEEQDKQKQLNKPIDLIDIDTDDVNIT